MKGNFRDALGQAFVKAGTDHPQLSIVTADVSKSTRSIKFKEKFPDRFYSVGIAEANAVGIAAGLATFGTPVIFTAYAVFATEKPFEQIRNMIAYPNLNVKIVATHGGINVGQDGATHQAVEDIAIMRAIPGMKVVTVADPGEVTPALSALLTIPGPAYLRLGRSDAEVIHTDPDTVDFQIGKAEILRRGNDITLIGTGMMVWECLQAAQALHTEGIEARVINIRTIKPIDMTVLRSAACETGAIVTAEDHNAFGGLYGAVAEALAQTAPVPVERVALDDTFGESGPCFEILAKYGLSASAIVDKARAAIQRKAPTVAAVG